MAGNGFLNYLLMQSIFIPSQQNNKVNANTKQSKIKQQKTGYQSVKRKNSVI